MATCIVCAKDVVRNGETDPYHADDGRGHAAVTEITDWQTQTDVKPRGSLLNDEVYYACYSLSIGAADVTSTLHPSLELYTADFEYAFRRFALQYSLSTQHEVFMHSHDVISHVVTEKARGKNIPVFTPPF